MNKFFKRIGAILVALTLCLGASTTAFAAESENVEVESTAEEGIMPASSIVNSWVSKSFQTQEIYTFDLTTTYWYADFYVAVRTNNGANYSVSITAPNGDKISETVLGDAGVHFVGRFTYAPAGTYTVNISRRTGSAITVTALTVLYN